MWTKKAIILVDDELIILQCLKIQLERFLGRDIILELASTGAETKAIIDELYINQTNILLIISDYNLDDCKGTDLLIYCNEKFPNSKKIILSGQLDSEAISNFKETVGLHALFSKPWTFEEIRKSICEIPSIIPS